MSADLIITNARILTMDRIRPRAEAIAVRGNRILAVGSRAEIERLAGPETRMADGGGCTLLPGFVESHMHLFPGGTELDHIHIGGLAGEAAVTAALRSFAADHPKRPIIIGQGADYGILGRAMDRHALDAIAADRPLAIMSHDHHTVWANTEGLRAAGLLHGAVTPPGHEVVMGGDGLATGELREFEAFGAIMALAGETRANLGLATGAEPATPPTPAERAADRARLARGLAHCAAHGVTSIVNMDGNHYTLDLLQEMRRRGELTARVKVPFHFKPGMDLVELDRACAMTAEFHDEWLSSGMVKMFMDGVIDSGTAYMLDDYADTPGHRGAPLFTPDQFASVATEIDRRGLQIAVHAIGDGAVRITLDGYEAARLGNGIRDARHRIEHIEVIDAADIPRLAALGVVASLQPPHPPGAMDFPLEPALSKIGARRFGGAYLARSLVAAGVDIAFASDWPVADISVMRGIQAAMTRQAYPGAADERLALMPVLAAYTSQGAWAAHADTRIGRLAPGLLADMVLLEGDIESLLAEGIGPMGIAATICGGRISFGAIPA